MRSDVSFYIAMLASSWKVLLLHFAEDVHFSYIIYFPQVEIISVIREEKKAITKYKSKKWIKQFQINKAEQARSRYVENRFSLHLFLSSFSFLFFCHFLIFTSPILNLFNIQRLSCLAMSRPFYNIDSKIPYSSSMLPHLRLCSIRGITQWSSIMSR